MRKCPGIWKPKKGMSFSSNLILKIKAGTWNFVLGIKPGRKSCYRQEPFIERSRVRHFPRFLKVCFFVCLDRIDTSHLIHRLSESRRLRP